MNPNMKSTQYTVPEAERIDVRAGCCDYGQMVALGRLLDAEYKREQEGKGDAVRLFRGLIKTLHPGIDPTLTFDNARYAKEIAAAVYYWKEREAKLLKYEPSAEEKQAGYEALAAVTGPSGVASTLAEKFGVSDGPDAVFKWPYKTVFMILYIDLERFKFQQRLEKIRENKRKRNKGR